MIWIWYCGSLWMAGTRAKVPVTLTVKAKMVKESFIFSVSSAIVVESKFLWTTVGGRIQSHGQGWDLGLYID